MSVEDNAWNMAFKVDVNHEDQYPSSLTVTLREYIPGILAKITIAWWCHICKARTRQKV
jgi:hypothetical protein